MTVYQLRKYFEDNIYVLHEEFSKYACRLMKNVDDANDVLQKAYENMWKALLESGTPEKAKPWAYRIINNCAKMHWRKEKKHSRGVSNISWNEESGEEYDLYELIEIEDNNPLTEVIENFQKDLAVRTLDYLSDDEKILLIMYDVQDMTMDELVEYYNEPYGTISSRISRTRRKYRFLYFELEKGKRK